MTADEIKALTVEILRAHLNDEEDREIALMKSAPIEVVLSGLVSMFAVVIRNSTSDVNAFCDALLLEDYQPRKRGLSAFLRRNH